jgi:alpha-galactosidase
MLQTRAVTPGTFVLESRKGVTSHQANPWIALSRNATGEEAGPVWFGALGWSGSWRINVEMDAMGGVHATAGYNPFDFNYRLKPGESLASPVFHAGFSEQGFGGASRLFHRYQREKILPHAPAPRLRPVLYNSWEATLFDVNEAGQMALAEQAARIGVERFVVDDGWFGARNSDKTGLGDWVVNRKKFPNGQACEWAGHAIRAVGRTGNGEPRQRPVSRPPRLGDPFPRPAALGGAQPAGAQPGAQGCLPAPAEGAGRPAVEPQYRLPQMGP